MCLKTLAMRCFVTGNEISANGKLSNLGISEKKRENTGFPVAKDRNIGERRGFLESRSTGVSKTNPAIPEQKSENPAIPEAKTANIGI